MAIFWTVVGILALVLITLAIINHINKRAAKHKEKLAHEALQKIGDLYGDALKKDRIKRGLSE